MVKGNTALDKFGHHLVCPDIVPIIIPIQYIEFVFHAMAPCPVDQHYIKL